MGGRADNLEEQQREADIGPAGVHGQRGGVEATVEFVQRGELEAENEPH